MLENLEYLVIFDFKGVCAIGISCNHKSSLLVILVSSIFQVIAFWKITIGISSYITVALYQNIARGWSTSKRRSIICWASNTSCWLNTLILLFITQRKNERFCILYVLKPRGWEPVSLSKSTKHFIILVLYYHKGVWMVVTQSMKIFSSKSMFGSPEKQFRFKITRGVILQQPFS